MTSGNRDIAEQQCILDDETFYDIFENIIIRTGLLNYLGNESGNGVVEPGTSVRSFRLYGLP